MGLIDAIPLPAESGLKPGAIKCRLPPHHRPRRRGSEALRIPKMFAVKKPFDALRLRHPSSATAIPQRLGKNTERLGIDTNMHKLSPKAVKPVWLLG